MSRWCAAIDKKAVESQSQNDFNGLQYRFDA
jgi:hypothetical protein